MAPKSSDPSKSNSTVTLMQTQLPMWPQNLRGLPNVFARSAFFNIANVRSGPRKNYKRREIASLQGITITHSGEEMRQDDCDVFLQILHLARMQNLGTVVRFTAHSMLTELGWTRNTGSYKRLADCLDRQTASAVAVTVSGKDLVRENYTGSLIRLFRWKEDGDAAGPASREWTVVLEPEIIALFGPSSYSHLNWKTRLKLSPLGKWLHAFYHTHAEPFPYKVETLHRISDSQTKDLRHFRYKLKAALAKLVEEDFFLSAEIDARTDLVSVVRKHQTLL